jgi:glycosyltransferase involved in cell wall biosynthesis
VGVIAIGVALAGVRYRPARERRAIGAKDVLFVGLMSHGPNEEGAEFLAREVMPLVWERVADARLVLCGRQPSAKVIALTSPRVEVTGTVPSVAPFLDRARVVAVPLGHGAGSSLKAVEALASGATVVSTAVGMRGIEGARAGLTHREAERAEDFADAIVRSFTDAGPADDGASARARAVAERYDWTRIGEEFLKLVREASA